MRTYRLTSAESAAYDDAIDIVMQSIDKDYNLGQMHNYIAAAIGLAARDPKLRSNHFLISCWWEMFSPGTPGAAHGVRVNIRTFAGEAVVFVRRHKPLPANTMQWAPTTDRLAPMPQPRFSRHAR